MLRKQSRVDVGFRDDYIKLHDCKQSAHPAANYVVTWLSPEALPVWEAVGDGEMAQDFEEEHYIYQSSV